MWLRIGISLKIDIITLVVIAKDNWRTDDCFEYMLKTWLNCMEPFPCWKHLAMALQSIGINVLLGMLYSFYVCIGIHFYMFNRNSCSLSINRK